MVDVHVGERGLSSVQWAQLLELMTGQFTCRPTVVAVKTWVRRKRTWPVRAVSGLQTWLTMGAWGNLTLSWETRMSGDTSLLPGTLMPDRWGAHCPTYSPGHPWGRTLDLWSCVWGHSFCLPWMLWNPWHWDICGLHGLWLANVQWGLYSNGST